MAFVDEILGRKRPASLVEFELPRRLSFFPSSPDWRDEVLYFLLPDRFSDENERPLLNRNDILAARQFPKAPDVPPTPDGWRWDNWAKSGAERWQGGTLRGIISRLDYLKNLGVTTLWIGPIFKQRGGQNTFHGYGIQDFLEVDAHLGTRQDLVDLVKAAHDRDLRVILDIIFNHSGSNFVYPDDTPPAEERTPGKFKARYTDGRYPFGAWRGNRDQDLPGDPVGDDDGVFPRELQDEDAYTRAGSGSLDATPEQLNDPNAEHKRSDFEVLRDINLDGSDVLTNIARCYKYWIALTDCDGFRIDTLKHVSFEQARNFCGTIKEFATTLGKKDFLLIGEIAGGNFNQRRFLEVLGINLNAALDIGEMRPILTDVAKGLRHPLDYFNGFDPRVDFFMGSHRNIGKHHVSILNDHDHVFGEKLRFSTGTGSDHQVAGAVGLQLLTLGISCIFYGTEQAFAGPEASETKFLPEYGSSDRYLREAMFGPDNPRKSSLDGLGPPPESLDNTLPGFGPFGTRGHHCFDPTHPAYRRIAATAAVRKQYPVLRYGRQYPRQISLFERDFEFIGPGQLIAWSRILDDEEALCILNAHGRDRRGGDVIVDAKLNPPNSTMTVTLNTAEAGTSAFSGTHPLGSVLPVKRKADGTTFVEVRDVQPSGLLIFSNRP